MKIIENVGVLLMEKFMWKIVEGRKNLLINLLFMNLLGGRKRTQLGEIHWMTIQYYYINKDQNIDYIILVDASHLYKDYSF